MFPIPWNFPFRKKNGNLVNIGDAIDEGTELPEHGEGDAGKVLSVDENGDLEWSDDVSSEIQTLTNNLSDEVETRAKLGAHNLLAATFASKTIGGVAFTVNSDGTISVANGTTNASAALTATTGFTLKKGTYIITLGHTPESITNDGTFNIKGHKVGSATLETLVSFNVNAANSATKVLNDDYVITEIYFNVNSGMVFANDVKYYPMIRLATDTDTTYQPYAMTNRELTEKLLKYVEVENITTGADGFFALNSNSIGGHIVSCISHGSHLILPGALAIYSNNEENYFVSLNPSTLAKEASTNIGTIRVYYIPIN